MGVKDILESKGEDILSLKVDVVNEKALHHCIRDRVLSEAIRL